MSARDWLPGITMRYLGRGDDGRDLGWEVLRDGKRIGVAYDPVTLLGWLLVTMDDEPGDSA